MASAPGNENGSKRIFGSFTFVTLVLAVIVGLLLAGTAIYHTSLWQNGARPPLDLSKKILWTQMVFVLALLVSILFHLVTTLIHLVNGNRWHALMAIAGTVVSIAALVFSMAYDRGSIFHQ